MVSANYSLFPLKIRQLFLPTPLILVIPKLGEESNSLCHMLAVNCTGDLNHTGRRKALTPTDIMPIAFFWS